jgi:hypothetical protein
MGATSLLKVTGLWLAPTLSAAREGNGFRKIPDIANVSAGVACLLSKLMMDLL